MHTDTSTAPADRSQQHRDRNTGRQRRVVAGAIALALILLATLFAAGRDRGEVAIDDASPATEAVAANPGSRGVTASSVSGPGDAPESGAAFDIGGTNEDLAVDLIAGESGASSSGSSASLDGGGVEPADPCAALPPGRSLLVTPDHLALPATVMASHLVVRNCNDGSIDWSAHTVPVVSLGIAGGTLAGGAQIEVPFTIDEDQLDAGAFDFKIKISEPGANTYIDVHAFNGIIKATNAQLPNPAFGAGHHAGGCSQQCITKAWLTPAVGTANLGLEVTTTVPASVKVWVSTIAPSWNDDVPWFPAISPIAADPALLTQRDLALAPLKPTTSYHIIVEATDANDHRAYQVGTFTTVTPAAATPNLAPTQDSAGCASQCINKAVVTGSAGTTDASIEVATSVPAAFEVFVSEQAPTQHGQGTPYFPGSSPLASTGGALHSSWTANLTGLASSQTYHVIVVAVDGEGRKAYRTGTFTTLHVEHTVQVTFHQIHVISDGDGGDNPGELAFALGVGNLVVASTKDRTISSGTTVHLNGSAGVTHTAIGVGDHLPALWVEGYERDGLAKPNICDSLGFGPVRQPSNWGHTGPTCNRMWNTAASGIHAMVDFDQINACSEVNVPVGADPTDRCMVIEAPEQGPGYPVFRVLVSLRIID